MTVEWNKPTSASLYNGEFIQQLSARINQAATLFADPDASSTPTDAVRWNATNKRFEKWNGSTWVDLMSGGLALGGGLTVSGDVGIGTSSPLSKVHIKHSSADVVCFERTENNGIYARWRRPNREYVLGLDVSNNGGDDFFLYDATAGALRWIVDGSGNVGIGTSSPPAGSKLAIQADGTNLIAVNAINNASNVSRYGFGGNAEPGAVYTSIEGDGRNNGYLAFRTNDTERARIDASGNLGLGVTPSAWGTLTGLDISSWAGIAGYSNQIVCTGNAYYDGSIWRYKGTGVATRYEQNSSGEHSWHAAVAGTAGNAISFTQLMKLDSNGADVVALKINGNDLVPVGTVAAILDSTAPAGWLEMNGNTIGSVSSGATARANADTLALYTKIWNATSNADLPIQTSTGTGTTRGASAAADFADNKRLPLPDMRGEFLRGWDHGKGTDASRALGSAQSGELGAHSHGVNDPGHSHVTYTDVSIGPSSMTSGSHVTGVSRFGNDSAAPAIQSAGTGISIQSSGGAETRPRNIALMYVIKY